MASSSETIFHFNSVNQNVTENIKILVSSRKKLLNVHDESVSEVTNLASTAITAYPISMLTQIQHHY